MKAWMRQDRPELPGLVAGGLMIYGAGQQWGTEAGLFAAGLWVMLALLITYLRQLAKGVTFISEYQLEGPGGDKRRQLGWHDEEDDS
jgi:hypothetical protein